MNSPEVKELPPQGGAAGGVSAEARAAETAETAGTAGTAGTAETAETAETAGTAEAARPSAEAVAGEADTGEADTGEADTGEAGTARYRVKIVHSSATEVYQADRGLGLVRGDFVIVPTRYGAELGRVQGRVAGRAGGEEAAAIERKASPEEVERCQACAHREANAFQVCRNKIAEHGLDMKLVSAHYLVGESKILFYFTAEARVDFRELVKDLVGVFKMRIELRQIGVRDEARVVGGVGVCGRTYCCHGITDKLKAVSIKMAKEQNLTLNSMKISGPCGRLLCCLAYEYDTYRECRRGLPSEGARLRADGQTLKVLDVNIFTRTLKLAGEDGKTVTLGFDAVGLDAQSGQWQVREGS
jgi:cell fate regulator YaaT (PSP1 superfamily)